MHDIEDDMKHFARHKRQVLTVNCSKPQQHQQQRAPLLVWPTSDTDRTGPDDQHSPGLSRL